MLIYIPISERNLRKFQMKMRKQISGDNLSKHQRRKLYLMFYFKHGMSFGNKQASLEFLMQEAHELHGEGTFGSSYLPFSVF